MAMNPTKRAPRTKRFREPTSAYLKGVAAARAMKPLSAIDDEGFGDYAVLQRDDWLWGWRDNHGDIVRGIVVLPRQRLEEERAKLMERIAWIDNELSKETKP